jgi:hypothetical protein
MSATQDVCGDASDFKAVALRRGGEVIAADAAVEQIRGGGAAAGERARRRGELIRARAAGELVAPRW